MICFSCYQVQAVDRDSAPNAGITYKLVGGDDLDQFSIDSKEGFISINSPLDRETVSINKQTLNMLVIRYDAGDFSINSTTLPTD